MLITVRTIALGLKICL